MRSAILWGLFAVAGAINPAYQPMPNEIFVFISTMFILMDIWDLGKK